MTSRSLRSAAAAFAVAIICALTVWSAVSVSAEPRASVGAWRARTQPDTMPKAATSGAPKITQVRKGKVIATYTHLGQDGPFQRTHAWNVLQPGDVFLVYPAVYEGPGQYPWIGPRSDNADEYDRGITHRPTNVTIRGVTVNGVRPVIRMGAEGDYNILGHAPVEIEDADGLTIENIDVDGSGDDWVDRSGVYVIGGRNVTLRNMRIHGFQHMQHNGVFAAGASRGTLLLQNLRLYDNGGWDGPAHNVYVNESSVDPNYTVRLDASYSTAVNIGHLFKSRAQITVITGSLLEGTNVPAGWDSAESFDLDVPNGGRLTVRNNVFVKGRSGPWANGVLLRYAAEGADPNRKHAIQIDHNTFIARSVTYDDAGHLNVPMTFYTPFAVPKSASWPKGVAVTVDANRFEGFRTAGAEAYARYRGTHAVDVPG